MAPPAASPARAKRVHALCILACLCIEKAPPPPTRRPSERPPRQQRRPDRPVVEIVELAADRHALAPARSPSPRAAPARRRCNAPSSARRWWRSAPGSPPARPPPPPAPRAPGCAAPPAPPRPAPTAPRRAHDSARETPRRAPSPRGRPPSRPRRARRSPAPDRRRSRRARRSRCCRSAGTPAPSPPPRPAPPASGSSSSSRRRIIASTARRAERGPSPGSRAISAISRSTLASPASAHAQNGSFMPGGSSSPSVTLAISACAAAIGPRLRVLDRRDDQVLDHLALLRHEERRVDRQPLHRRPWRSP